MTDAEKKLERQQEKEEQREKRRQERQKIASLHGKKRLQYLWDYYKVWLVFLAIAIVAVNIAVTIVRGLMTKTLLQVSALSADYSATGDQMQKDFSSYIGGLKKHEELSFDLSIDLHPGAVTQAEQVADVKLQVQVSSGTLDVVLVPDYAFSYIQQRGMLMSLDDVLSPEEIETYGKAGDLAYASTPDLQALSEQDASEAVADYKPQNNRSQLTETGRNSLVVDAYNANPTSMAAALENFSMIKAQDKMLILGDMRELGEASDAEHRKIVEEIVKYGFTQVWLVGSEFAKAADGSGFRLFADVDEVNKALESEKIAGKTILIKGSNSIGLTKTITNL